MSPQKWNDSGQPCAAAQPLPRCTRACMLARAPCKQCGTCINLHTPAHVCTHHHLCMRACMRKHAHRPVCAFLHSPRPQMHVAHAKRAGVSSTPKSLPASSACPRLYAAWTCRRTAPASNFLSAQQCIVACQQFKAAPDTAIRYSLHMCAFTLFLSTHIGSLPHA